VPFEGSVAYTYHRVDSENGDHFDDLNDIDNTFVVIQPAEDDPAWHVSVVVRDACEGYEAVRRDTRSREHDVTTGENISDIAHEFVLWLEGRSRLRSTIRGRSLMVHDRRPAGDVRPPYLTKSHSRL
jgi:hypothetical protein